MKKFYKILVPLFLIVSRVFATGEPSTYFNIYVPPNNTNVHRDAALYITAISDSTTFQIIDDAADGDADDSKTGVLMKGQSYILYIRDNGINDDANLASGGILKWDGDYFIIKTNKNVYAGQGTNSDWQHDWVPSVNQKSIGEKFIVYSQQTVSSKNDLNVFAYFDSTYVTIKRISKTATTKTGYTDVFKDSSVIVKSRMLKRGEDLIYKYTDGRDVMDNGHTYIVECSKPSTLQYGALYGNERDGGGYVPSSNGSSTGELFYFGVPYQSGGEQEIRIVSWDANNAITLERYSNGLWIQTKTWTLGANQFGDWVGKNAGNVSYATVFRLKCTAGKRISVFEGNWFETGSPGTSDMATMVSSELGSSAGTKFISYMAPPGDEGYCYSNLTQTRINQSLTHLYIFANRNDTVHVNVVDSYTGGTKINRSYTILPEKYVDCYLTLAQWKTIYNGTGTTIAGPERPYLTVTSDKPVSVMNTNFNDNWMMYFGSSQKPAVQQVTVKAIDKVEPGETKSSVTKVVVDNFNGVQNPSITVEVGYGLQVVSSSFVDSTAHLRYVGVINDTSSKGTKITYANVPNLDYTHDYYFVTSVKGTFTDNDGNVVVDNDVANINTNVSGVTSGNTLESTHTDGADLNTANTSRYIFSEATTMPWYITTSNSWTSNWVDINGDGLDDLFIPDRDKTKTNNLYIQNSNHTFTKVTTGGIANDKATNTSASFADIDNDGDMDCFVTSNGYKPNLFYKNNGNGTFTADNSQFLTSLNNIEYFHGVSWVDYDNDGFVDLYLTNYWPTKFNQLYHNNGDGTFTYQNNNILSKQKGSNVTCSWIDYDNDGKMDVFLPSNDSTLNNLYHNDGKGNFSKITNSGLTNDGGRSTAACWGDIDNDGDMDLFVANQSNGKNFLYTNNGNSTFTKITTGDVVNNISNSHGCSFQDIDNDGDLDLYVTNDRGASYLYLNNGNGTFTKNLEELITSRLPGAMGTSWSDYDRDGDLDLMVTCHSNRKSYLFKNSTQSKNRTWGCIKFVGTKSNKAAIGCRIKMKSNGMWQTRQIVSQDGVGGQSSLRQFFGMNAAAKMDSIIVYWPSGYIQTVTNLSAKQNYTIIEPAGNTITGIAYVDANNNCTKDAGEALVANQTLTIMPGNIKVNTDDNGAYSVYLKSGSYTITHNANAVYTKSTCMNGYGFTISGVNQTFNLRNYALTILQNKPDLKVLASTTALRRGFKNKYYFKVSNNGALAASNVTLEISFPNSIIVKSADVNWASVSNITGGKKYVWNISSLNVNQHFYLTVNDSVDLASNLDDMIDVFAEAKLSSGTDVDASDNSVHDINKIVGSIDPNDLIAYPTGDGEQHIIQASQPITYKVRFQNVGNTAAQFVRIEIPISSQLDETSIRNISSSHHYTYSVNENNVIFIFDQINLPDSGANMANSNGFVQFTISPIADILEGALIKQKASIIFDYNDAMITNEVFHTIFTKEKISVDEPMGTLILYPNPTNGWLNIQALQKNITVEKPILLKILVMDVLGQIIVEKDVMDSKLNLDFTKLSIGQYLLKAVDNKGKSYSEQFIIAH
ncbi:MAG: hypothetical protein RJA07_2368 [Bacteroidota bacterium]|jgi:hypothetical protein